MAAYNIEFKNSVFKDTRRIPKEDLQKILTRINTLREDPKQPGCIKLTGENYYRMRQGDYRIIYEIIENRVVVLIVRIAHRREVYR